MRYFKNPTSGKVHAYDETVPSQLPYMDIAIKDNWIEVTGSWPPPPPPLTLAQQAAALLTGTVAITSTSTASLSGNYTVTQADQNHIAAEIQSIMLTNTFADGTTTVSWPDSTGVLHTFTIAEFKTFAMALGSFVAACYKCITGATTTLPNTALTI